MLTNSSNNANIDQCYIIILAQLHISPVNIDLSARDLKKINDSARELCRTLSRCKTLQENNSCNETHITIAA